MNSNIVTWSPGVSLENIEKQVILAAYRHYRGNKTMTANALGIAIRTLDNKLEKYEADDKTVMEKENARKLERQEQLKRHRGNVPTNDFFAYPKDVAAQDHADGFDSPVGPDFKPIQRSRNAWDVKPGVETLPSGAEAIQNASADAVQSEAGARMESAENAPAQSPVSVHVGKEVQSVPSKHASGNRNRR